MTHRSATNRMRIGQDGSNLTGRYAGCAGKATVTGVPRGRVARLPSPRLRGESHTRPEKTRSRPGEGAFPQAQTCGEAPSSRLLPARRGEGVRGPAPPKTIGSRNRASRPKNLAVTGLDLLGPCLDRGRIIL